MGCLKISLEAETSSLKDDQNAESSASLKLKKY